jgi:hypothetical protein
MKRIFAALFLGLVVALVVAASGVASADPPNDFTTGAGKIERTQGPSTVEEKFAFSAYDEDDSPSTQAARNGHFAYEFTQFTATSLLTELDIKGSVDCVVVDGNHAAFSGPIKKSSSNPELEGQHAYFSVVDNDSTGMPDQFLFHGIHFPLPCDGFPEAQDITSGNILVSDAP